jgi:alkanesulfonate monooxygenase SsuD/methylene tetrahydromethanopterin reductase-like flavin-dependent oxidoreductase (luciferase family)
MKVGLHMPVMEWQDGASQLGATLTRMVEEAEGAGFDTIAVADHVWQHPIMGGPIKNQVEAYTTLGFIAALTDRVRLLALATAASYRPAGLLAKEVTTLDVLSGGRTMLGIGAGDYPEEAEGLGLQYPSLGDRFEMLEETVQTCLRMWRGEHGDDRAFDGKHVRIGRALNVPQSIARPHPPILIAGSGERRTLPLVARYADACNILFPNLTGVKRAPLTVSLAIRQSK